MPRNIRYLSCHFAVFVQNFRALWIFCDMDPFYLIHEAPNIYPKKDINKETFDPWQFILFWSIGAVFYSIMSSVYIIHHKSSHSTWSKLMKIPKHIKLARSKKKTAETLWVGRLGCLLMKTINLTSRNWKILKKEIPKNLIKKHLKTK